MGTLTISERARLGGLKRITLHGNPGTPLGRSKGGKKTIDFFRKNPSYAQTVGFVRRKEIKYPERSEKLAEIIGIILGDGALPGNHQLTISFNYETDNQYASYICNLLKELFSVNYYVHKRKDSNGGVIVVSSMNLINFLLTQGLLKGNKIKNQIDMPSWIKERLNYQIACSRGLMDTDGGLYLHKYRSNSKFYEYPKLCFTSHSKPLLRSVHEVFSKLNFKVYLRGHHVSIYSLSEVKRYFREIGSHNPKHLLRFEKYFDRLN